MTLRVFAPGKISQDFFMCFYKHLRIMDEFSSNIIANILIPIECFIVRTWFEWLVYRTCNFLLIWLFVWILWHINLCRLFNAKSIFMKIVLFQTIQFSIRTQFKCEKTFLFQAIQFSQAVLLLNVKTVLY